jgi:N-acetylmuramoyl-L-alanine amidase
VRSGDTLSEIAERYDVTSAAVRIVNSLSDDRVRIGQTLTIPPAGRE